MIFNKSLKCKTCNKRMMSVAKYFKEAEDVELMLFIPHVEKRDGSFMGGVHLLELSGKYEMVKKLANSEYDIKKARVCAECHDSFSYSKQSGKWESLNGNLTSIKSLVAQHRIVDYYKFKDAYKAWLTSDKNPFNK